MLPRSHTGKLNRPAGRTPYYNHWRYDNTPLGPHPKWRLVSGCLQKRSSSFHFGQSIGQVFRIDNTNEVYLGDDQTSSLQEFNHCPHPTLSKRLRDHGIRPRHKSIRGNRFVYQVVLRDSFSCLPGRMFGRVDILAIATDFHGYCSIDL